MWQAGDEIIVTNQDHEANSGVWRRLDEFGLIVTEWQVDRETGRLDLAELERLLSDRTRLVAFPHCSNVIADINPVAEITAKAHAVGAHVVVDGVAYAPHGFPDVSALDVDVYLFSLYKTYGPHQGLMCVRRALLDRLTPQGHFFNSGFPRKRLIPAGPDHAQIAAATGIADYFDAVHAHHFDEYVEDGEKGRVIHDLFRAREISLLTPLLDWLRARDDVRIIGPDNAEQRAPTVSILPLRRPIADVMIELQRHKIMAGSGHFYAVRTLQGMGIDPSAGLLRISFVHYTTPAEVNRLIEALDEAL
jgi:selenocysteine lyase/cysteine desulfurase